MAGSQEACVSTKCKGKKGVFLLPSPTKTRLLNKVFTKAPQPHEIKGKAQLP